MKGISVKQYLPHGVLKVVKICEVSSKGKVQNPLFTSIFDTFVTFLMDEVTSWKVLGLCTLNLSALLMVLGSRHTLSLPLGLHARTKLWHQSVASFMLSFLITPRLVTLSVSCFRGSTMA